MKSKVAQTPTRTRKDKPPTGLVTMMSLVRQDGETSIASEWNARKAYPLAQRVIGELRGAEVKREWDSLDKVAIRMFPGLEDEPPTETTCALSGFYIGVAVAWLLLQELNGNGGAK